MLSAEQYYAKNFMHTLAFYNIHCILGFIDKLRERERERERQREKEKKKERKRGREKQRWKEERELEDRGE